MGRLIIGDSNSLFINFNRFKNISQPGHRVNDSVEIIKKIEGGDTLVIGVGVNDSATIKDLRSDSSIGPNIEYFRDDYSTLLDLAQNKFEEIIVLGLVSSDEQPTILGDAEITYSNKTIGKFNDCIKELCKNAGIDFINLLPHFLGKEDEPLDDHIHPNKVGQDIILLELSSRIYK